MTYTVLARRYRSRTFQELVGQNTIAQTLQSAIAQNRVAHAYLFTGTRGVGKTSTARIFANALNNPDNDPAIARSVMQGQDTDTIEIDAASNNSVDNARELIANASYRPMRGRKKVYIIDEVHMLSNAAFNALLKTMEEPPDHVVFILCTTETHKVPATIQSRCQRFDFRPISAGEIAGHLREVLTQESIRFDDEVLLMVARLANGSMRDALSLVERLLASGQKHLTVTLLEGLLGLADRTLMVEFVDAIAQANPRAALETADTLFRKGTGFDLFCTTLAERMRDLMVLQACGDKTELVELAGEGRDVAIAQSARFDAAGLSYMIALVESIAKAAKNSSVPRALIDAMIVRLAFSEKFADVTGILTARGAPAGPAQPPAGQVHVPPRPGMSPAGAPAKKR
jgi:DNA polymerase-3 subunit gamma/tau